MLREHPDVVLHALSSDGEIVALPESLELHGYPELEAEGRTGVDLWVAEDRMAIVNAWTQVKEVGVVDAHGRLCSNPDQWMEGRLLDLRPQHGVVLAMMWPTDEGPGDDDPRSLSGPPTATPRFATRKQSPDGLLIECDEAYLRMFGYSAEEVIGRPSVERVHPDDQARVIEGWIASVATGRVQMYRVRMRCGDGSWLWTDTTLHNYIDDPERGYVLAESIDVSAEMSAQEALADREELLRNLLEEMPDGVLQLDAAGNVVYHNPRLLEILAPSLAAQATPALSDLLCELTRESSETLHAALARVRANGIREDVEVETVAQRAILMKVRPLQRGGGTVTGIIASVLDVTDSARARRELERRATYDALTGAHNRASIMEALRHALEESPDTGIVFIDLDHFKAVNDTLGHGAGDELLVLVAEQLRGVMRTSDELGRLGGDEFLVVLRGVCGLDVAMGAAQRISEAVRGTYELACGSVEMCASVGVACVEGSRTSPEELVERADIAMYRSKEHRRGIPVLAA
jgi:diguanylate cyclase (GGDEF)-like protein/PAS domain S-box-containing protein